MLHNLINRINPFNKKIHLAVVYVEYDRKKGGTSDQIFAKLQQYLSALKGGRITYLRVDNKYENMSYAKIDSNVFTVGGNNLWREFSGWQRGVDTLASLQCQHDLLLITNEMFLKPGPSFLQDYATLEVLKKSLSEKKIIGRIDSTFQHYTLFGYDVSSWICTNCVFIPRKAFEALGNIVLINDNIHEIFPPNYNPHHVIKREQFPLSSGRGDFCLECDLPGGQNNDIRVRFDIPVAEQGVGVSDGNSRRAAIINEISLNGHPLPKECLIRGFSTDHGVLWSEQSFLLGLPRDDAQSCQLVITGCLPPETHQKTFHNETSIVVYNDALLYQENAPINKPYQRWIVEWLTEKWHSRFEINQDTWDLFTLKAAAIFNESLLTAKLKELGYPPETYGNKKYY